MPNNTAYLKEGDTDDLVVQLYDAAGVAMPLPEGVTAEFKMRNAKTKALVTTGGDVSAAPTGRLTYVWGPGETDTPGNYEAQFVLTFVTGKVQTVPKFGFINVQIGSTF